MSSPTPFSFFLKTSIICLCISSGLLAANFVFATEKIDINTASLEDLVKIIHIGKVRALDLISLRPFSSLDDLIRIKGIGESRIEDIKKQGWAWSKNLTPGETNIITQPEISKTDSSETFEEKEEGEKVLARIGDELPKSSNPLIVFLIALTIAISSGIIVLFLKKKIGREG